MKAKRIIPCLDMKDGKTVKGVNFVNLREVGDPVEMAQYYEGQGADELVFLDINATYEGRKTMVELAKKVANAIKIPFTVGGGIAELKDADRLLEAGVGKVSINSAAVRNPGFINELAARFGSSRVVLAIDGVDDENGQWKVTINGGRVITDRELYDWAKEGEGRGAGEILFTSMKHDGTKDGFACNELAKLSEILNIPVTASGGAGTMEHFVDAFLIGKADAALAASVFHFNEIEIPALKKYLKGKGIFVR